MWCIIVTTAAKSSGAKAIDLSIYIETIVKNIKDTEANTIEDISIKENTAKIVDFRKCLKVRSDPGKIGQKCIHTEVCT